jgi:Glycosyl transferase family 2
VRLALVLCVRDEDDIITEFLDYHLARGFGPILVHDTGSTDTTPRILARYTPAVEISHSQETGFDQSRLVTRLARRAYTVHHADWVFPVDADEFVWCDTNPADLLAGVDDAHAALHLPRANFGPVAEDGRPWHQRMVYRHTASHTPFGSPLPGKIAHRGRSDIDVDHGGHALLSPALPVAPAPNGLCLLHFPLRTLDQTRRKVVTGAARLASTAGLSSSVGRTWKALARLDAAGALPIYWRALRLTPDLARQRLTDGSLAYDDRLAVALGTRTIR